jgi:hypothetical protein
VATTDDDLQLLVSLARRCDAAAQRALLYNRAPPSRVVVLSSLVLDDSRYVQRFAVRGGDAGDDANGGGGEEIALTLTMRRVPSHAGPRATALAWCTPILKEFLSRRSFLSAQGPSISIPTYLDAFQLRF